jgi:NAD(P)-dependent dehydrogenase (short-subunit alcohol dehydrogenase family)
MPKLIGKVAVIIGGSSGIGLATAKRFVSEGAYVFITGRRQSELDKAKVEIGHNVSTVQGDVTSLADIDRLFAHIQAEKGVVDIVVASAGFIEQAPLATATPEHFDRTFSTNVRGVFFAVKEALPLMSRGGSIVLVSSALHMKGFPGHTTYSATKAALRSFARTWAAELKGMGIRVNTLSPGAIDTLLIDGQFKTKQDADDAKAMYADMTPLGRLGHVDEMANAAFFLASDESSFSTGMDLVADGGVAQV